MTNLQVQLDDYCKALRNRALDTALDLFSESALFEMPLLGQRLIGKPEIKAGLQRIFEVTEWAEIEIAHAEESACVIIAEGHLRAKLRRDRSAVGMAVALVLEATVLESTNRSISRLSQYLDARPYRLWSDGPILVRSASSAKVIQCR
jgi:ketosteroid isomerase-like protein